MTAPHPLREVLDALRAVGVSTPDVARELHVSQGYLRAVAHGKYGDAAPVVARVRDIDPERIERSQVPSWMAREEVLALRGMGLTLERISRLLSSHRQSVANLSSCPDPDRLVSGRMYRRIRALRISEQERLEQERVAALPVEPRLPGKAEARSLVRQVGDLVRDSPHTCGAELEAIARSIGIQVVREELPPALGRRIRAALSPCW